MMKNIRFVLIMISLLLLFWLISDEYSSAIPQSSTQSCLECHADVDMMKEINPSLLVDQDKYTSSVHGKTGFQCVDCHIDLEGTKDFPHKENLQIVQCQLCHQEIFAKYSESIHGKSLLQKENDEAASCVNCHGSHYILPKENPESMIFHRNIPHTCSLCHMDEKIAPARDIEGSEIVKSYLTSAHGWALTRSGLIVSAVCTDCHGAHDIKSVSDYYSEVSRENIPTTCTKCHEGIYTVFIESIHGQKFLEGNRDVPICTDCHGEHNIKPHYDPESAIYASHISEMCAKCHENERLIGEYKLPTARLSSYLKSFHGVASEFGDVTVANCSSCHGHHDIRPADDPKSTIHSDNISKTCGQCHPGIDKSIIKGKIHLAVTKQSHWTVRLAKSLYAILIITMVTGFIAFIVTDVFAKRRERTERNLS